MVNWERETGERIEDFCAAYLLMRAGAGNQIRPSQGDRGIDVQIPTGDGWEIYQVKRFATNLTSSAKAQIVESWKRFEAEVLPTRTVKSWSLVLPLEPTSQNEAWLAQLTSNSGCEIRWIGRALLDGWAAENPKLTAYFFGGGEDRLHDLMATALSGGQQPTGEGDSLLTSVQQRTRALSDALDEVDPFYRYELELRSGRIDDFSPEDVMRQPDRPGLVHSTLEQVSEHQYLATHVIARSAVSTELRPIRGTYRFEPGSPEEQDALEKFVFYGAPMSQGAGTILKTEGPPGTTSSDSSSAWAWTLTPSGDGEMPPLEMRLIGADGATALVLSVTAATRSAAVQGDGIWLRAETGPAVAFEYFIGAKERDDSVVVKTDLAVGAAPAEVLPGIEFVSRLQGHTLHLAIQGGQRIMPPFSFDTNPLSRGAAEYTRFVRCLAILQKHTFERVLLPSEDDVDEGKMDHLTRMAALLDGRRVTGSFDEYPVPDERFFAEWDEHERPLVIERPISVSFGSRTYTTQMNERQHLESVRLDRSVVPPLLRASASRVVWSVAVPRAQGGATEPMASEPEGQ